MPEPKPDSIPEEDNNLSTIHAAARAEFDTIESVQAPERRLCLEDRRFCDVTGAQWEGDLEDFFENRVKMEFNKVQISFTRILDEYRNNRIAVDFISKDGADVDELAELCDGLLRADEQDSNADEAYDNAFEEGGKGGIGGWRLRAELENPEDDEDDRQRIRFEPIYDADSSIYFSLGAKRQSKSDAKACYVLTFVPTSEYIEEWDDDPASWPKAVTGVEFDWSTADGVYVAEYYKVEEVKSTIHIYKGLDDKEVRYRDTEFEADEELEDTLLATGFTKVREKKVKRQRVHKYIMSGSKILEDCGYVAGPNIPIIQNFGKRAVVDNIERAMGHIRLSKDPQRSGNIQRSRLTEIAALSGIEKPIFTPEQIAAHGPMWATDNTENNAYLLVDSLKDANGQIIANGPIDYTRAPTIPPALAALIQINDQDLRDILGNTQGRNEIVSNISGKAEEIIQTRLDMQAYIYISNFAKAKQRSGEVWLGMAKELYVEDLRKMKTIDSQAKVKQVQLNQPIVVEGDSTYKNDLSGANLGLAVTVGPSSSSKKASTVRSVKEMMQVTTDPESMQVLSAIAMMNMEGEGIDDAKDFFRNKLLRMGAVEPTKEEAEKLAAEAANQPPDPNTEYLGAAAREADANAVAARTKTAKTIAEVDKIQADTEKTQAETAETLAGIGADKKELLADLTSDIVEEREPSPL